MRRTDAGVQLTKRLLQYRGADTVVYALPPGGVVIGYTIAKLLGAPLDLVIPGRIKYPGDDEHTLCSLTEDGKPICNGKECKTVSATWLAQRRIKEHNESRRTRAIYTGCYEPMSAEGKIAIIADDGITTGLTMRAAIQTIKKQAPAKIVVMCPVAPQSVKEILKEEGNEIIIHVLDYGSRDPIGAYSTRFPEVTDSEVMELLRRTHQRGEGPV